MIIASRLWGNATGRTTLTQLRYDPETRQFALAKGRPVIEAVGGETSVAVGLSPEGLRVDECSRTYAQSWAWESGLTLEDFNRLTGFTP